MFWCSKKRKTCIHSFIYPFIYRVTGEQLEVEWRIEALKNIQRKDAEDNYKSNKRKVKLFSLTSL